MKSAIFFSSSILFLFFYLPTALSQIGVKGGLGISDIAFKKDGQVPYLGYEIGSLEHRLPKLAFEVGATAILDLNKRFDFQPELLYIFQGLDYSTEYLYDNIAYKINISYLKMPLLFRYKVCMKEKKRSGFFVGPYGSLKLKAVRVTEVEGQKEKTKMSNVKNGDFGIILGYSLDLDLPSGQVVIDLRGSYSLINLMDRLDGYIQWYYGPSKEYVRNVVISLSVGYRFSKSWGI